MIISQVLKKIGNRQVPACSPDMHINEVVELIAKSRHSQVAYVVDDHNRMIGTISVDKLLRHLYPHYYGEQMFVHGILGRISAESHETAGNLMESRHVHAVEKDTVDEVLQRMARTGMMELAVLNSEGVVVGDLTAADLLHFYHLEHVRNQSPG